VFAFSSPQTGRPSSVFKRLFPVPSAGAFALLLIASWFGIAEAQGLTGSIKGTVSATTADPSARPSLLPAARLALVNRDIQGVPVKAVTDDSGNFAFLDLPAANYTLTVEADGLPSVKKEIHLTTGATLVVEIIMTASLTESVTVQQEEGLLSTAETTTSNTVRAEKLEELPLRAENYQSALPLTPGVVRGLDGSDHVKGTRAGQSSYTVNGADVTDPVSGNLAFDIPVEAAESVHIEENPYSAEYGRFTGGATNLETKTGGNKFKFTLSRFFPTYRNIIGGKLDSFRPRMTFSGPLLTNRLTFLQSFEYRYSRTRVPSLKAPRDDSASEAVDSFTQFDLKVNKRHSMKFVGGIFPQKIRFVGLDTFNPQQTRPNTKQRGELFSLSEQAIFNNESFLSSLVSYKTFQFDVFSQGPQGLTIIPDGNTGNYYANIQRASRRLQWQENYFAHPFDFHGQHSFKLGAELDYTTLRGAFDFRSILIRRSDQTLSERIDFAGPTSLRRSLGELSAFVQDRWTISKSLTLDTGLRLDRDNISERSNFAPRFSVMFLPFKNDRTVVRGGFGLFYDRSPVSSKYFDLAALDDNDDPLSDTSVIGVASPTRFPQRTVTTYAIDGKSVVEGPRSYMNVIRGPLRDARSVRWSVQIDRGLTRHLTSRLGYVERSTRNEPLIVPRINKLGDGMLIFKTRGRSHYQELQAILAYNSRRFHNVNASYVWSKARGDLNTADNFLGDFPALAVNANQYGPLPFDAPHRFLAYGEVKIPWNISVTPAFEIRSGFPYSFVNERLEFIGARNRAGRFPTFMSLDVQVLKGVKIPFFDKRARVGAAIFNITNHFNPRDIQNNLGSLNAGRFYNSLGTSVRGKFEMDF
jgi:Carboxypeptidase regulatory-like domain/TonB-dependent Receptor Plug Domain